MNRASMLLAVVVLATPAVAPAAPHPKKNTPKELTPEQKEADRHFKSGVALFGEQKFAEALAEFERAYDLAPAPIVLYNIAGCHRELSHYGDAVKYYNRFLTEGEGKVGKDRLAAAKTELDAILARIARVTVNVTPPSATLSLDGAPLAANTEMPLIVAPGEHKVAAQATGMVDAEKTVRVASGDDIKVELALVDRPADQPQIHVVPTQPVAHVEEAPKHLSIGAGFGTNLRQISSTGAPTLGVTAAIGSRLELGIDAVFVAYAVMPSVRVRLAGEGVAVFAIAAAPIAFTGAAMSGTFVAGAGGLGLRIKATSSVSLHLASFASFAGKAHGMTFPTFVGGELWF